MATISVLPTTKQKVEQLESLVDEYVRCSCTFSIDSGAISATRVLEARNELANFLLKDPMVLVELMVAFHVARELGSDWARQVLLRALSSCQPSEVDSQP